MFANFKFAKVFAVALLPFLPLFLKGQCAPQISAPSLQLILIYDAPTTPENLASIDVVLGDGSMNGTYDVFKLSNTWQTVGNDDFTQLTLTGSLTIHYNDGTPSIICDYINGIYNDPLPIELSIFNGHLMENDVFLTWSTESESENAGFEIERSFDGEVFERIAFENGAGDSEEKLWYSFIDYDVKNVALGKAVYYRLKQIDYDQTSWYSQVVVVDLKIDIEGFKITKILGWNNPDRIIKVYFYNPANIKKINISVATINGKLIEQKSIYPQTGFNFFEIDLSNQKENMFFIALNNGKQTTVEKLILHPFD
jgi:hypothetical protein